MWNGTLLFKIHLMRRVDGKQETVRQESGRTELARRRDRNAFPQALRMDLSDGLQAA